MPLPKIAPGHILAPLAARTSWAIDIAWTQVIHGVTPLDPFFPKGWGNLEAVNWPHDEKIFMSDPPSLQMNWTKLSEGTIRGVEYERLKGIFSTPHDDRMMRALPRESHTAMIHLIQPKNLSNDTSLVLHLAGTGDHGFARRTKIGMPLVAQNIAMMALESPFYGSRRPPDQQGSRLHHVADLLTLGRTTIMEGLCLLEWANQQGYGSLGTTGLSMGGVHASMIGGLCRHEVAVTPHLTPRSAAVAFCEGALNRATAFGPLSQSEISCEYIRSVAAQTPKPNLARLPKKADPVGAERLAAVLETYTDVTRYPRPKRHDAAIIVAATDDAYVSRESVLEIHRYWDGSEVRWVPGGHVVSFLLHTNAFRRAIVDSLDRLRPTSQQQHGSSFIQADAT